MKSTWASGPTSPLYTDAALLDVAIINREIDETDGADRNDNRSGEDVRVLYREGRVWASLPDMKLDCERPVPLALFPAPCTWRQLAQERLQRAGRRWTIALQSTGLSGIVTAVEAGLAISIFAQSGLSPRGCGRSVPRRVFRLCRISNTSFAAMPSRQ